jgi:hypothetical protein
MVSALGHHLNETVLVSIPSIFDDFEHRACTLTIEVSGLKVRISRGNYYIPMTSGPALLFFVPLAQIAYLLARTNQPDSYTFGKKKYLRPRKGKRKRLHPKKDV